MRYSDAKVVSAVTDAMAASKVDSVPIITLHTHACTFGMHWDRSFRVRLSSKITICRNMQLNPSSTGPQQCGSLVSFQYPYQFSIPFVTINMQSIQFDGRR